MKPSGRAVTYKHNKPHLTQVGLIGAQCALEVGEEETTPLPYTHPLQDFQAVLRGATQQFLDGLWFCDIKTLEEGAVEVLSKERESQEALESHNHLRAAMHFSAHDLGAPSYRFSAARHTPDLLEGTHTAHPHRV